MIETDPAHGARGMLWRSVAAPIVAIAALFMSVFNADAQTGEAVIYEGGMIWTGDGFERRDVAVQNGAFIDLEGAGRSPRRVDLRGKYLTPPYANAHHHITSSNDAAGWTFLEHGVFYVLNPNLISTVWSDEAAAYYARRDTYDVRTSLGGVTEPGGHPEKLYVDILTRFAYPGKTYQDFYKVAFHYGRTPEEIDGALDLLVEQGATYVKSYLLYSEEYELRRDDDAYYGLKGLNPENFPYFVSAAHVRGLPVAVHVETRHDAIVATDAGADMLAHLPGYLVPKTEKELRQMILTEEDAAKIAAAKTLCVATYGVAPASYSRMDDKPAVEFIARHYDAQAANLRHLANSGAAILTGTDGSTAIYDEVKHWIEIGGLTPAQALRYVYETGPYLFPDRKIGRIEPGYEADFLVMNANPADHIDNLSAIDQRVKAGKVIGAPGE